MAATLRMVDLEPPPPFRKQKFVQLPALRKIHTTMAPTNNSISIQDVGHSVQSLRTSYYSTEGFQMENNISDGLHTHGDIQI